MCANLVVPRSKGWVKIRIKICNPPRALQALMATKDEAPAQLGLALLQVACGAPLRGEAAQVRGFGERA